MILLHILIIPTTAIWISDGYILTKSTNILNRMKLVVAVCHCKYTCLLPFAPCDRNSPGFDLTELWIRYLHMQGQSRHPYAHLQLCAQVAVGEVHHHPHSPTCLLAIDVHIIAPFGHLRGRDTNQTADKQSIQATLYSKQH